MILHLALAKCIVLQYESNTLTVFNVTYHGQSWGGGEGPRAPLSLRFFRNVLKVVLCNNPKDVQVLWVWCEVVLAKIVFVHLVLNFLDSPFIHQQITNLVHSDGFGGLFSTSLSDVSVLLGLVVETVVFTLNNEPMRNSTCYTIFKM